MSAFDDGLWTRLVDEHDADRVALGSVPARRSKRLRKRPLLLGAGGLAALSVAGVLAAVLSLAGEAGNAFAGWSAQPTAPTAAQLAAAKAYCAKNVPDPGLPLKLIDARGPFTFMVYSDGSLERLLHDRSVVPKRVGVEHLAARDGPRRPAVSVDRPRVVQ